MIADVGLEEFSIGLREPVVTARGTILERVGILLTLTDSSGRTGTGEVAPLPGWSSRDLEVARAELATWAEATARMGESAPSDGFVPEVRAGIDVALWCLRAAVGGSPLWQTIDSEGQSSIAVNALLSQPDPSELATSARQAQVDGYSTLKVKVGLADDTARFVALADVLTPDVLVRLDANGAWSVGEAVGTAETAAAIFGEHLEYIEDPVVTLAEMRRFREQSSVPLAVDRLASSAADLSVLLEVAEVLVLKPALWGGITETLVTAATATDAGVDVVISSLIDGPVGLSAWCHLAAALGGSRAHGLGTASLLDSSAAAPLVAHNGRVQL